MFRHVIHFQSSWVKSLHKMSRCAELWPCKVAEAKECFLEKLEKMDLTMLTCLNTPERFVLKALEDPRVSNLKIDLDLLEAKDVSDSWDFWVVTCRWYTVLMSALVYLIPSCDTRWHKHPYLLIDSPCLMLRKASVISYAVFTWKKFQRVLLRPYKRVGMDMKGISQVEGKIYKRNNRTIIRFGGVSHAFLSSCRFPLQSIHCMMLSERPCFPFKGGTRLCVDFV